MGIYTEFLDKNLDFPSLTAERKKVLGTISKLRDNRDIIVLASDLTKNVNNSIDYSDILPFQDQLSNLHGDKIDVILETPGGLAEVVEDLVELLRDKYERVGIIVPGWAKSAGTIFAMAGDEILMGKQSALGPIDAQIVSNNKRFSADAFLDGFKKIKEEVANAGGKLNTAYIPILQNISPGEIQHCENAQKFSEKLVTDWLAKYKFKYWDKHSSTGMDVTQQEKDLRASEIAGKLCKHSDWLTHGRSIKIKDFRTMRLIITDFSENIELNDAIIRYYTLLRMTFETTNIYKIYETPGSQVYRFMLSTNPMQTSPPIMQGKKQSQAAIIDFQCPNCKKHSSIQANIEKHSDLKPGSVPYPIKDNVFACPHCGSSNNILSIKLQIEAQSGKKIVE